MLDESFVNIMILSLALSPPPLPPMSLEWGGKEEGVHDRRSDDVCFRVSVLM